MILKAESDLSPFLPGDKAKKGPVPYKKGVKPGLPIEAKPGLPIEAKPELTIEAEQALVPPLKLRDSTGAVYWAKEEIEIMIDCESLVDKAPGKPIIVHAEGAPPRVVKVAKATKREFDTVIVVDKEQLRESREETLATLAKEISKVKQEGEVGWLIEKLNVRDVLAFPVDSQSNLDKGIRLITDSANTRIEAEKEFWDSGQDIAVSLGVNSEVYKEYRNNALERMEAALASKSARLIEVLPSSPNTGFSSSEKASELKEGMLLEFYDFRADCRKEIKLGEFLSRAEAISPGLQPHPSLDIVDGTYPEQLVVPEGEKIPIEEYAPIVERMIGGKKAADLLRLLDSTFGEIQEGLPGLIGLGFTRDMVEKLLVRLEANGIPEDLGSLGYRLDEAEDEDDPFERYLFEELKFLCNFITKLREAKVRLHPALRDVLVFNSIPAEAGDNGQEYTMRMSFTPCKIAGNEYRITVGNQDPRMSSRQFTVRPAAFEKGLSVYDQFEVLISRHYSHIAGNPDLTEEEEQVMRKFYSDPGNMFVQRGNIRFEFGRPTGGNGNSWFKTHPLDEFSAIGFYIDFDPFRGIELIPYFEVKTANHDFIFCGDPVLSREVQHNGRNVITAEQLRGIFPGEARRVLRGSDRRRVQATV
jgi:hypothetical protein